MTRDERTARRYDFRSNNFDLIRLFAALQVVLMHAVIHLRADLGLLAEFLHYFPGVPAFFFISGFLVSAAWERNPSAITFYSNRFRRIFPALWASVVIAALCLWVFMGLGALEAHSLAFCVWLIAQSTIGQSWNPDFLRTFGVSVVNGALWTIPVEVAFYAAMPIFARSRTTVLAVAVVGSFILNYTVAASEPTLFEKIVMASPVPWLGMFLLGTIGRRMFEGLYPIVAGRFWIWLALYATVSYATLVAPSYPFLIVGNTMGILNSVIQCGLILSAAYSFRGLSDRILNRNDLSYGVYLMHMLIINVAIESGMTGLRALVIVIPAIIGVAAASWWLIEKPALAHGRAASQRGYRSLIFARSTSPAAT